MRYQIINFKCPKCGHHSILAHQEIIETVYLECVYEPGFFGYGDTEDSEVVKTFLYTCASCSFELGTNGDEIVDWLDEQGMLGEMQDDRL